MLTEIQVIRGNSHLHYLRRIVSCVGAQIGMSRREIEEAHKAMSEICGGTPRTSTALEGNDCVSVKLCADDSAMTIEISDSTQDQPRAQSLQNQDDMAHAIDLVERIRSLVDRIELIRGDGIVTLLITKYVRKHDHSPLGSPVTYVPALGVSSLHR